MKKTSFIILFAAIASGGNAYADIPFSCVINAHATTSDCPDCTSVNRLIVCSKDSYCDCNTCKNGNPTPTEVKISALEIFTYNACPHGIIVGPIGGLCPDECPSSDWSDVSGQNYQVRCNDDNLLNPVCEYQCKIGYYGTGKSCTECPASGGVHGTTSGAGATAITECFLPAGTAFSDGTGSGTYTDNCYYSL